MPETSGIQRSVDDFSWNDITPIPQDDGPNPAVPIAYTPEFKRTMDLFRALLARKETSPRALALTKAAIELNAANYTVWHFRRVILEALNEDLEKERTYLNAIGLQNPKNYQLWYHRRWLASKLKSHSVRGELEFTSTIISMDTKNYHAWSHRQWVLKELGGIQHELDYCHSLISMDIRNNSAWNQRFWVITHNETMGGISSMRSKEIQYCADAIALDANNESSWLYLRGLLQSNSSKSSFIQDEQVSELCRKVKIAHPECFHVLSFMLDRLCHGYQPNSEDFKAFDMEEGCSSVENMAQALCERLILEDPMHANYWKFRKAMLSSS